MPLPLAVVNQNLMSIAREGNSALAARVERLNQIIEDLSNEVKSCDLDATLHTLIDYILEHDDVGRGAARGSASLESSKLLEKFSDTLQEQRAIVADQTRKGLIEKCECRDILSQHAEKR